MNRATIQLPLGPEFLYGYRRTKMVEDHDAHCLEHHWNQKHEPIFNPDVAVGAPPPDNLMNTYVNASFPYLRSTKEGFMSEYYETMYSYAYESTLERSTSAGLGLHGTVPYANLGLDGTLDGSFKYKRIINSNRWKFFAYYMHPVLAVEMDETKLSPADFNDKFIADLNAIHTSLTTPPKEDEKEKDEETTEEEEEGEKKEKEKEETSEDEGEKKKKVKKKKQKEETPEEVAKRKEEEKQRVEEISSKELELWQAFLKKWGTHYLKQVHVGGKIVCSAHLSMNSRNNIYGASVEGTLKATLEQALGGSVHGKYNFDYSKKTRESFSTVTFEDEGGYPTFSLPTKVLSTDDLSNSWANNKQALGDWKKRIVEGEDVRPIFHIFVPIELLFEKAVGARAAEILIKSRKKLYPTLVKIYRLHHHHHSSRKSAMALVERKNRWWTDEVGSVDDLSSDDRGIFLEYKLPPSELGEHRRCYYNVAAQRFISAESVEYLHASLARHPQTHFNKIELTGAAWAPNTFFLESLYTPLKGQSRSLYASKRHHKEVKLCKHPKLPDPKQPAPAAPTDGHATPSHRFEWRIEKP